MSVFLTVKTVFQPLQRFSRLQNHHFRKHEIPSTSTPCTREVWVPANALWVPSVIMSQITFGVALIYVNRALYKTIFIIKSCSNSNFTRIWTSIPILITRIKEATISHNARLYLWKRFYWKKCPFAPSELHTLSLWLLKAKFLQAMKTRIREWKLETEREAFLWTFGSPTWPG